MPIVNLGNIVSTTHHFSFHGIIVNDGTKTMEMMTSPVEGCNNMNFRYHNDRADFSVEGDVNVQH